MTAALVLTLAVSPWVLWAMYVMVMGIYRAHLDKRLTTVTTILAAPWVAIGYLVDALVNLTFASILFWEPPWELLVTGRLKRHIAAISGGWRHRLAMWICDRLLDPFDPTGNHCRRRQ